MPFVILYLFLVFVSPLISANCFLRWGYFPSKVFYSILLCLHYFRRGNSVLLLDTTTPKIDRNVSHRWPHTSPPATVSRPKEDVRVHKRQLHRRIRQSCGVHRDARSAAVDVWHVLAHDLGAARLHHRHDHEFFFDFSTAFPSVFLQWIYKIWSKLFELST